MRRSAILTMVGLVAVGSAAAAWLLPPGSFDTGGRSSRPAASRDGSVPAYPVRVALPAPHIVTSGEAAIAPGAPPRDLATGLAVREADKIEPPGAPPPPSASPSRAGLLESDFSIAGFARGGSAPEGGVRASKTVRLGPVVLGSVELALGHGSVVMVERGGLQALLASKDARLAAALADLDGEMVPFDALRDRGVSIRYDPLADAVVIDPSG